MNIAIMQPYFFPYIGYFQLMHAVDIFIFYDNAQYMKGGWVNRNRICHRGIPRWMTIPVQRASHTLPINRRKYAHDASTTARNVLVEHYNSSEHFEHAFPLISALLPHPDANVAEANAHLLRMTAEKLGLSSRWLCTSEIEQPPQLKGQERIIDLCKQVHADRYINSIGGVDLYDPRDFAEAGLELSFLSSTTTPRTFADGSTGHLSIIHDIMVDGFDASAQECESYTLLDHAQACNRA